VWPVTVMCTGPSIRAVLTASEITSRASGVIFDLSKSKKTMKLRTSGGGGGGAGGASITGGGGGAGGNSATGGGGGAGGGTYTRANFVGVGFGEDPNPTPKKLARVYV